MKLERRVSLPWLLAGAVVACAWCSFLSGLGGWIMSRDLARREQQSAIETAVASRANLAPLGVLITRVDRAGPAAVAGVQRGDTIVALDGTHVEDARDLRDQLRSLSPGTSVELTVVGDQGQSVIKVTLSSVPGDSRKPYLGVYYTARGDDPADL